MNNIFFLIVVLLSCSSGSDKRMATTPPNAPASKFFIDINIYELKGIAELKGISYPCVEIRDSNGVKILIFHVSPVRRIRNEYIYIDSIWSSKFQSKGDTSMVYTYEFILPNRIVTFNYSNISTFNLIDASIATENKEVTYTFDKQNPMSIEPKPEQVETIARKAAAKYELEVNRRNSSFIITDKEFDNRGELISVKRDCYQAHGNTFCWWQAFGETFSHKIDCAL